MKHNWTYQGDYLIAQDFIEVTVLAKTNITLSEYVGRMAKCFPNIPVQSIRMKAQNIKGCLVSKGIPCAAIGATLEHSSAQCRNAVDEALEHYRSNLARMGISV